MKTSCTINKKMLWNWFVVFVVCLPVSLSAQSIAEKKEIEKLLGESYLAEKEYDKALTHYRGIAAKDPQDVYALMKIGDILSWQHQLGEAIEFYEKARSLSPDDTALLVQLARVYTWNKQYKEARDILEPLQKKYPENQEVRILLADQAAYTQDFGTAETLYKEALRTSNDRAVRIKLADTISWSKDYTRARIMYDELLDEEDDPRIRLQKARMLGWAHQYRSALDEYKALVEKTQDEVIALEMEAKRALWNRRTFQAIERYQDLIERDPHNVEARFDLAQIYSHESMWDAAHDQYRQILEDVSGHFKAQEASNAIEYHRSHIMSESLFAYYEADSAGRQTDIDKISWGEHVRVPLYDTCSFDARYTLTERDFADYDTTLEQKSRIATLIHLNPYLWGTAYYSFVDYDKEISPVHEYGGEYGMRIIDATRLTFWYDRERLENNSTVIRKGYYRDAYRVRTDVDVCQRVSGGLEYLYGRYSFANDMHEPSGDITWRILLEPKALYLSYRYLFRDFDELSPEYFSPQDFSVHAWSISWKHYLNKDDVFWGAKDMYYQTKYEVSLDAGDIVSHAFSGGCGWDITQRLGLKAECQTVHTSADVYEDGRVQTTLTYIF